MIIEDPINVYWYIQGNFRMFLWKYLPILLRKHIKEQFLYRFYTADRCTANESCLFCGCSVSKGLYFANKACSLSKLKDPEMREAITGRKTPCYPEMLNVYDWEMYKFKNKIK